MRSTRKLSNIDLSGKRRHIASNTTDNNPVKSGNSNVVGEQFSVASQDRHLGVPSDVTSIRRLTSFE